jgi:hypothetical protein
LPKENTAVVTVLLRSTTEDSNTSSNTA